MSSAVIKTIQDKVTLKRNQGEIQCFRDRGPRYERKRPAKKEKERTGLSVVLTEGNQEAVIKPRADGTKTRTRPD